jgi:hypothetical protein
MTIQVYRVYPIDAVEDAEYAHLFSIVATEDEAHYAVPQIVGVEDFAGYDDDRIAQALAMATEIPKTPLDWALVASTNMSMLDVKPVDAQYDSIEDALAEESSLAEDAWSLRNPQYGEVQEQ